MATARFSMASISCCCSQVLRPGRDGQSIFLTVAIQTPLNSRAIGGGIVSVLEIAFCAVSGDTAAVDSVKAVAIGRSHKKRNFITWPDRSGVHRGPTAW